MLYLHCVVKFQLPKLDCALTWYKNAVPQLKSLELKMTKSQNNSFELEAFKVFN